MENEVKTWAVVHEGRVVNLVLWDGVSEWQPHEGKVMALPDDQMIQIGDYWDAETGFYAEPEPEPTQEELRFEAGLKRARLIADAQDHINGKQWPSKLQLGRLSEEEKVQFNLWLDYLDALTSVDVSDAPDIEWPQSPEA
ncbi:tail fiber assembly protein [Klebsiella pneumoniae]|nr:tail fiber assembly protein [Klebsiella pneumoniae]